MGPACLPACLPCSLPALPGMGWVAFLLPHSACPPFLLPCHLPFFLPCDFLCQHMLPCIPDLLGHAFPLPHPCRYAPLPVPSFLLPHTLLCAPVACPFCLPVCIPGVLCALPFCLPCPCPSPLLVLFLPWDLLCLYFPTCPLPLTCSYPHHPCSAFLPTPNSCLYFTWRLDLQVALLISCLACFFPTGATTTASGIAYFFITQASFPTLQPSHLPGFHSSLFTCVVYLWLTPSPHTPLHAYPFPLPFPTAYTTPYTTLPCRMVTTLVCALYMCALGFSSTHTYHLYYHLLLPAPMDPLPVCLAWFALPSCFPYLPFPTHTLVSTPTYALPSHPHLGCLFPITLGWVVILPVGHLGSLTPTFLPLLLCLLLQFNSPAPTTWFTTFFSVSCHGCFIAFLFSAAVPFTSLPTTYYRFIMTCLVPTWLPPSAFLPTACLYTCHTFFNSCVGLYLYTPWVWLHTCLQRCLTGTGLFCSGLYFTTTFTHTHSSTHITFHYAMPSPIFPTYISFLPQFPHRTPDALAYPLHPVLHIFFFSQLPLDSLQFLTPTSAPHYIYHLYFLLPLSLPTTFILPLAHLPTTLPYTTHHLLYHRLLTLAFPHGHFATTNFIHTVITGYLPTGFFPTTSFTLPSYVMCGGGSG